MRTISQQTLAAAFMLAITFTFNACSGDDPVADEASSSSDANSISSSGGGGSSSSGVSSSGGGSSSSGTAVSSSSGSNPSSSSSLVITAVYGTPVTDVDGQTYKTVVIGSQTWMAKNLNREIAGSVCYGDIKENCDKYGRLYDWATVMSGAEGNEKKPSGVQGICPAGFHIPSVLEWNELYYKVIKDYGFTGQISLRAASGWGEIGDEVTKTFGYNDNYGFSALPGGFSSNGIYSTGDSAAFWSTTDNGTNAYRFNLTGLATKAKSNKNSLRCLKDTPPPSSSSYTPVSCTKVPEGGFCDDRDGKAYKSVTIGAQTWMAENLNYKPKECELNKGTGLLMSDWECSCYGNNPSNCDEYGMLYNRLAAMFFEPVCGNNYCASQITSPHQGICPTGWHLPSEAERNELIQYAGGTSIAGQKLKTKLGWSNANGTDEFGFSALPGGSGSDYGYTYSNGSSYANIGTNAYWWNVKPGSISSPYWGIYGSSSVITSSSVFGSTYSVRCIKD